MWETDGLSSSSPACTRTTSLHVWIPAPLFVVSFSSPLLRVPPWVWAGHGVTLSIFPLNTRGKSSSLFSIFFNKLHSALRSPAIKDQEEKKTWKNLWAFDLFWFFSFLWVTSESPPSNNHRIGDPCRFKELKWGGFKAKAMLWMWFKEF